MFKAPTFKEGHRRSLVRSIIWRIIGILVLALITYIYTRSLITTTLITVVHHGVFIFGYYIHERFWLWAKWLRGSKWKPFVRVITYEVILGNVVLGIISYAFTGSLQQMTLITLTYIANKYWIYYAYDYVWSKVKWQTSPYVRVYTYVVADLFHTGHLNCLKQAKALGDYLIVGVLTDKAVEAYKRTPIIPFWERATIVANIKCVDEVIRQDTLDPTANLKKLGDVDIVVHGDDWDDDFPGAKYMRSIGKKAMRVKWYPGHPTTQQIACLQGYMKRIEDEKLESGRH